MLLKWSVLLTSASFIGAQDVATTGVVDFDPDALRFSCSDASAAPSTPLHLSDIDTTYSEVTVLLDPIGSIGLNATNSTDDDDSKGRMCVLSRWTKSLEDKLTGDGYYFPLGRSVSTIDGEGGGNNNGDWNRPAGHSSWQLSYSCGVANNTGTNFDAGEYLCEVTLPKTSKQNLKNPMLTDELNAPYYLTYYERVLSVRNEIARFLHQVTFGPTSEELDELEAKYLELTTGVEYVNGTVEDLGENSTDIMDVNATNFTLLSHTEAMTKLQIDWVTSQMDPTTFTSGKFSSHREYWRRRLNPRRWETYRIGEAGPAPCELHSRWRKFAFTDYDVQNSRSLRWGNVELGSAYQTQVGHKVTVETVTLGGVPSASPSISLMPSLSSLPTPLPTSASPTGVPTASLTGKPTISMAPTAENILGFADFEDATDQQLKNSWPARISTSIVRLNPNITDPALDPNTPFVHSGLASLNVANGRGFIVRQIGGDCAPNRVKEAIVAGDVLRITFWVNMKAANKVIMLYTGHYHQSKPKPWAIQKDDSNIISRTRISKANTWTRVEAIHTVGDDWTWDDELLVPERCNHYQLRIKTDGTTAGFYLDDFKVEKVASGSPYALEAKDVRHGFLKNPDFAMSFQYWKSISAAADTVFDADQGKEVARMRRSRRLIQNIVGEAIPGDTYQFAFWAKLSGTPSVDTRIIVRMRWENDDLVNGPCHKPVCNIFLRPLSTTIESNGRQWQRIVSDEFQMFGNYTEWPGKPTFILFTMLTKNMETTGELLVSNFEFMGDHSLSGEVFSDSPTITTVPSIQPTNMKAPDYIRYIVRYAGDVRTMIDYPFQVDSTGDVLPMDGSKQYQLCEIDEVEGKYGIFPNRMGFLLGGRCQQIRGGNPTVNIDPNFLNMTEIHLLDLTDENSTTITPINVEQTYGGDLLLESAVDEEICETFPNPYDNDHRGADPMNPLDVPSRFNPDQPVFAKLPDGSFALYDSRLITVENSLDNPTPDGGGASVLRSTIRAQRDGFKAKVSTSGRKEFYVFNDHNIALCNNEQPNFLNRDSCVLTYDENACVKEYEHSTNTFIDVQLVITFNEETMAKMHNATRASYREATATRPERDNSRFIYAVKNLRFDDSIADGTLNGTKIELPCYREGGNPTSRWIPRPDLDNSTCVSSLQEKTVAVLKHSLETSNDENPLIRDFVLWNSVEEEACDEADLFEFGMLIMTSEGCWENVHPDYMSLFDFTKYVDAHPMNTTTPDTSITGFKDIGIMEYPDSHPMSYFEDLKKQEGVQIRSLERYVYSTTSRVNQNARLGDKMIVDQFTSMVGISNDRLNLLAVADDLGTMMLSNQVEYNRGGGTLVCGSPNEVAPDPFLDDYFDGLEADQECFGCQMSYVNYYQQKQSVWTMNVLEAEDQFCQRMSWSLYEHLNVGITTAPDNTETNLYSYDILVRHCFGSYFDVLKEMVYNPKIGEQFNSVGSESARQKWDVQRMLVLPDENLGREIMQLFTLGMHELNYDGTEARDEFGRHIQTYDNYDIMSNARVLTGFIYTARRGNVEELFRSNKSRMDPMRINVDAHDFFPKPSVDGNWIGDRYPLCRHMPKHHFLKIGATFRFRGGSSLPQHHYAPSHWDSDESIRRFALSPESKLYEKLCNPNDNGECQFANTVSLDENLPCHGNECRVDEVVIVQVKPGTFYEYIRHPCVQLSFYDDAKKVVTGYSSKIAGVGRRHTHAMCAHPETAVAARSCCDVAFADIAEFNYKMEFHGERTVFATTELQCTTDGGRVCDANGLIADNPLVNIRTTYDNIFPSSNTMFWTNSSCALSLKVRADGLVAIVHEPAANPFFEDMTVPYVDANNTITYIRVPWEKDNMTFAEIFPTVNNTCGEGACSVTHDDACLCEVTVSEGAVFDSLPTREDILSTLKIGSLPPESFADDDVTYSLFETSDGVEAFVASSSSGIGAESTIFKVEDEFGNTLYLKNLASNISLGGFYTLRNPPNFIELSAPELRDVEYEIDAFLMSLIQHPTSPPFIAKNLLQLHGFSNPTPRQVERVASAFMKGSFTKGNSTFGDGRYGSLAAVAAAIALDAESVSPVLDLDPVHGQIREPLLKVIGVMRSLNFKRHPSVKFRHGLFDELSFKIGQNVFEPPAQFSFFSQDYQPPGAIAEAGLYSPESELLSMNAVVGITNGMFSLHNFGLTTAFGGFGPFLKGGFEVGDTSSSVGYLSYSPSASDVKGKIEELSTLLMAGRLSEENMQVIFDAYTSFNATNGTEVADRVMMKLLTSTPEFHSSNTLRKTGAPRPVTPPPEMSSTPYKAVVYINLFGGLDSFNVLVPHDNGGSCSLYNDYFEARGGVKGIGLTMDEILPIDGSTAGISGCNTFGLNNMLTAFKDIYEEGKGLFLANLGHLHKPVKKDNWMTETRTDLFSHHTMKKESHEVDAFKEGEGPGVMGRMLDVLERNGEAVSAIAVNTRAAMIDGSPKTGRLADIISADGLHKIYDNNWLSGQSQELRGLLESLHSETDDISGIFGNKWSQSFVDTWNKTDGLVESIRGVKTITDFDTRLDTAGISSSLKQVARLIQIRNERGVGINRDVFHVQQGGYDGHFDLKNNLETRLPSLNNAVGNFWAEIKAMGIADQVTVLIGSEFGRTINANSNAGSDHAWAGNYFMFGGEIRGGRILGEYPTSFGDSYHLNIGQGRLIPKHSWDSVWYGINQWMGNKDLDDIDYVLPNAANFGCDLFTDSDLYSSGTESLKGCGGPSHTSPVTMQLPSARYLTGEEQKSVCRLAVRAMANSLKFEPSNSRCYVDDQTIVPSELYPGLFDINGMAVINFDESVPAEKASPAAVANVMTVAAATASDFVVAGAVPQSAAPSESPSFHPSVSFMPSYQPSVSLMPSDQPSDQPSALPSVSSMPSDQPTISLMPTNSPSVGPTVSMKPTASPSISILPTVTQFPTPSPTARKVFEEGFTSRDIGSVGRAGGSSNPESGLHVVQGSGYDIYNYNDGFHYMYVETSGDVTFTALVENFSASRDWAKTGIMFRDSLSSASSHYSMYLTRNKGVANQYRTCTACSTYHAQSWFYSPSSVWLKVTKVGNVMTAYYRPASSTSSTWYQFGVSLSMVNIRSTGYYVGIAVTSRTNDGLATAEVSNIQLNRVCTSESITTLQCEQASNCEVGGLSSTCYYEGTMPSWENGYSYDGSFVASVLDVGSTLVPVNCEEGNSAAAVDRTTEKFHCDRSSYPSEVPGIIATPSHKQLSIVNGLRLYNPNQYAAGDPTEFTIQGRIQPGSLVKDKWDNLCWEVQTAEGNSVLPSACDLFNPLQLFYQSPSGNIRNVGLGSDSCLTKVDGDIIQFLACSSSDTQVWSYDTSSQRLMGAGICLDYNYNTGYLWHHPCHGGANQKFYFQEETYFSSSLVNGGSIQPGSLVKDKRDNLCWEVQPTDDNSLASNACNPSNLMQLFYQSPSGNIRNIGLGSDWCLTKVDNGIDDDGSDHLHFRACSSSDTQVWSYDTSSQRFVVGGMCLDYNYSTGYVWHHPCHGGSNQAFYLHEGTYFSSSLTGAESTWEDIATGPLEMSALERNDRGLPISSSYESGDESKFFVEASFLTNAIAYSEYRVLFPAQRQVDPPPTHLQFAEIELTGLIVDIPFEESEAHEGSGTDYFNMEEGFTGYCRDPSGLFYDEVRPAYPGLIKSAEHCAEWCHKFLEYPAPSSGGLVGFAYSPKVHLCWCAFEGGKIPSNLQNDPPVDFTLTPGVASGTPVYHSAIFADPESAFTYEVNEEFKCYKRDATKVGIYMQPNLNGASAPGLCHAETYNLVSIVKNFIKTDGGFSSFTIDESITDFNDPALVSKLASMRFFFMVDMEGTLSGWNSVSQGIMREFVQNGGTLVMTGTYGNKDTDFLNAAFGWDLTPEYCSSSYKNETNTAGTPWADEDVVLGCPSATQTINCRSVTCTPMWGTKDQAAVVVLPYGTGRVIYLGFDFYNTGYRVDDYHIDCGQRSDPWITSALRGSLLYAKSVSRAPEEESSVIRS